MNKEFTKLIYDAFSSYNTCARMVNSTQFAAISCSGDDLIKYRSSEECQLSINKPQLIQNIYCNPCLLKNIKQSMLYDIKSNCGVTIKGMLINKLNNIANPSNFPNTEVGANKLTFINSVITKVTSDEFIASIMQSVNAQQELFINVDTPFKGDIEQNGIYNIILEAVLKLDIDGNLDKIDNNGKYIPLTSETIPNVNTTEDKPISTVNSNYSFFLFFVLIILLIIITLVKKDNTSTNGGYF